MATYESATSRVSRLLTMVPWLLHRQGIDLAQAATELGVSEAQVVDDLQLLFVCGLPGHYPDDLIEASWEDGRVFVGNADAIARPLRLGRDEALALIVALRALAATPTRQTSLPSRESNVTCTRRPGVPLRFVSKSWVKKSSKPSRLPLAPGVA